MARYIDADSFIADKRNLYCKNCEKRKGMKNGKMRFCYEIGEAPCRACGINDMLDDIDDFETADVQEVKHGEWLENGANYKCSECGNVESYYSDSYCRCCGAKMDGEKKE